MKQSFSYVFSGVLIAVSAFAYAPSLYAAVSPLGNGATLINTTVLSPMTANQSNGFSVSYKNTGTTTWKAEDKYNLGILCPNRDSAFWNLSIWQSRVSLPNAVAPGETVTFFGIAHPTHTGTQNFCVQMVQDGKEWFGDQSTPVSITVNPQPASSSSSSISSTSSVSSSSSSVASSTSSVSSSSASSVSSSAASSVVSSVSSSSAASSVASSSSSIASSASSVSSSSSSVATNLRNDATILNITSMPETMMAGLTYPVIMNIKNTGDTNWTKADMYRIGATNPIDNQLWGFARVELPADVSVKPGENIRLSFAVTPKVVGTFPMQFQMLKEGKEWFGMKTANQTVKVLDNPLIARNAASFVSITEMPATMTKGQKMTISVKMKNTGTTTWKKADKYFLGSQNLTWGTSRIDLPVNIEPGDDVTFTFEIQAPARTRTYGMRWRMVQDTKEWFGDATPATRIRVTSAVQ